MNKIIISLFLLILFSCATPLTQDQLKEITQFYDKKVKDTASFLLDCEKISISPHEYRIAEIDGPHVVLWMGSTFGKEKGSVPIAFRVKGCGQRAIFLLLNSDRKAICGARRNTYLPIHDYGTKSCVPVQDSSFTREKK